MKPLELIGHTLAAIKNAVDLTEPGTEERKALLGLIAQALPTVELLPPGFGIVVETLRRHGRAEENHGKATAAPAGNLPDDRQGVDGVVPARRAPAARKAKVQ